jgi:glutamine amidotransferase-like uncharacterized protein
VTAPLALVYRGEAARPEECSDAVAALLRTSRHGFDVRYVGPREELPLTPAVLARATLYAQPGGGGLDPAYRRMRTFEPAIRDFVAAGGRYLGFCLGAYLAGTGPGFGLLPGDTDQYITTHGATVTSERDTLVRVRWRGRPRLLYFQDGPAFFLAPGARGVTVLARYPNDEIAALTAPFGRGVVGVVGPHPEATADWYTDAGLQAPDDRGADLGVGVHADLGHDLVDAVMDDRVAPTPHPRSAPR